MTSAARQRWPGAEHTKGENMISKDSGTWKLISGGKTSIVLGVLLMLLLTMLFVLPALAQLGGGYDNSWSSLDGGGGTISLCPCGLSNVGSIGQPDAGTMSGGSYTNRGGFL